MSDLFLYSSSCVLEYVHVGLEPPSSGGDNRRDAGPTRRRLSKSDGIVAGLTHCRPIPLVVSAVFDNPISRPTSWQTGHTPSSAPQRRGNEGREPLLLAVLLLHLLGLPGREVDVPDEDALEDEADEDDEEDREEDGLVVERHDGLLGGADGAEPFEPVASAGDFLAHCDGREWSSRGDSLGKGLGRGSSRGTKVEVRV